MPYFTIREIKEANRAAGHHFFEPSTMRFFNSRILRGVIGGRYFVTSEKFDEGYPRLYTVRECRPDGDIIAVSEFQQFDTPSKARVFARRLAAEDGSMSAPCADCGRWTLKRELSTDPGNAGYCPTCAARNE